MNHMAGPSFLFRVSIPNAARNGARNPGSGDDWPMKCAVLCCVVALLCAGCATTGWLGDHPRYPAVERLHRETLALVHWVDDDGHPTTERGGTSLAIYCSATWVGRHAILTAQHCIDAAG